MLRVEWAGSGQHDDLMGQMCTAGPHLGARQHPSTIGSNGFGGGRREVRARLRFAHADCREIPSRSDFRQYASALLLGTVRQQTRSDLTVGNPVRGHRRTAGQKFLGHHVAVQMTQTLAAVLLRNRQPDKAGIAQPRAERFIPIGQPRVDGRLPAEFGAIGGQEIPQPAPKLRQLRFVGA